MTTVAADGSNCPSSHPQLLGLTGAFHSDQWGDFQAYFRFQLSHAGKISRLDIGQTT
jgi:hypothetical protein